MESKLTYKQTRKFEKKIEFEGKEARLTVLARYDDECRNRVNTFSITGEVRRPGRRNFEMAGCIHELIAEHFPELRHLIKWHLFSSNGPLYYIANTLYHATEVFPTTATLFADYVNSDGLRVKFCTFCMPIAKAEKLVSKRPDRYRYKFEIDSRGYRAPDLEAARESALWPDATLEQLRDEELLKARLPGLIAEFRKDIEELGFEF